MPHVLDSFTQAVETVVPSRRTRRLPDDHLTLYLPGRTAGSQEHFGKARGLRKERPPPASQRPSPGVPAENTGTSARATVHMHSAVPRRHPRGPVGIPLTRGPVRFMATFLPPHTFPPLPAVVPSRMLCCISHTRPPFVPFAGSLLPSTSERPRR